MKSFINYKKTTQNSLFSITLFITFLFCDQCFQRNTPLKETQICIFGSPELKAKVRLVLTTILSLGTSQITKSMILDFSDIMDTSSKVLDNLDTFYHSKDRSNASWFVRLDSVYDVKWILISIRGGNNCIIVNINEECILVFT